MEQYKHNKQHGGDSLDLTIMEIGMHKHKGNLEIIRLSDVLYGGLWIVNFEKRATKYNLDVWCESGSSNWVKWNVKKYMNFANDRKGGQELFYIMRSWFER